MEWTVLWRRLTDINYVVTNTNDPRPGQDQDGGELCALIPVIVAHMEMMLMRKKWLDFYVQGK